MRPTTLFNRLNTPDPTENRREFISYLQSKSTGINSSPESAQKIAYDIAGMFVTVFAKTLPHDDPLIEIMTIAGELEVEPNNADQLRQELVAKIQNLL